MKICIIGKYPPIQGGVSMRTYWTAHRLAALGHEVHVVTNAKEATFPFRMHMRPDDWQRCGGSYESGSVALHWTDPVDRSQFFIPMSSPFTSKLATLATEAHKAHAFDVIFSHYLEPYGVAGHLAAQMTGLPHVVRMAGSDAGRLWRHPQLETLYDHVLRSAEIVVATHVVGARARDRGIDPRRIMAGGGYSLPEELFALEGPRLNVVRLKEEVAANTESAAAMWGNFPADRPYFGVYGKLGDNKGTFAVLAALHRLKGAGVDVGLVALAHGRPEMEARFRASVQELGLIDRILQLPFLPHWRVPEFLRSCVAVCCLEQDFPIGFHSPITPMEVLLCGACLVGSTEVVRKLPQWEKLAHGYSCFAVEDVNDIDELSGVLAAVMAAPETSARIGRRGEEITRSTQDDIDFPARIESILATAARREAPIAFAPTAASDNAARTNRFPFARMAAKILAAVNHRQGAGTITAQTVTDIDIEKARQLLGEINRAINDGTIAHAALAQAMEIEIAVVSAQQDDDPQAWQGADLDPLFRLHLVDSPIGDVDFAASVPVIARRLKVLQFDYDVSELHSAFGGPEPPRAAAPFPSCMIVFHHDANSDPLIIDAMTASFLKLVDGQKTVDTIIRQIDPKDLGSSKIDAGAKVGMDIGWIENLVRLGLIGLRPAHSLV